MNIIIGFIICGIVLPIVFLIRLIKWLWAQTGRNRRIKIFLLNFSAGGIYSLYFFNAANDYHGYSDIGVLDCGVLAIILFWFFVALFHMLFFWFYIEMDLQKGNLISGNQLEENAIEQKSIEENEKNKSIN